jgi:ribosomal protein S28E/S33
VAIPLDVSLNSDPARCSRATAVEALDRTGPVYQKSRTRNLSGDAVRVLHRAVAGLPVREWPQVRSRRAQRVYGVVRLRVKYQIAAAATMTSRITYHQSAIPPAGVAAASPGGVPGAVVWARARHGEVTRRASIVVSAVSETWRMFPPPDCSKSPTRSTRATTFL